MQTFKGSLIICDRGRSTIDSVYSSKGSFPPKVFRAGRREESASSVKNMPMFPFSTTILLGRASTGTMRLCTMTLKKGKEIGIPIFHSIVRVKKFDGFGKLGGDHFGKSIIKVFKFRSSFHEKKPTKPGKIINKNNEITRFPHSSSRGWAPNIQMYKIKRCMGNRNTFIEW
ncbi:hypothetical protein CsSME_00031331 [Camellia sinensis var. sinensis]